MLRYLEATLVPHRRRPSLFVWERPDRGAKAARGELDAVIAALVGPRGARRKRWLSLPAVWVDGEGAGDELRPVEVSGIEVPVGAALVALGTRPLDDLGHRSVSASIAVWSLAAKLALELVAGHRVVPWTEGVNGSAHARWRIAPDTADGLRIERLAASLPPVARACASAVERPQIASVLGATEAVETFLDGAADALLRVAERPRGKSAGDWADAIRRSVVGRNDALALRPVVDDALVDEVQRWVGTAATGGDGRAVRLVLRLEPPESDLGAWRLALLAGFAADPSLKVEASRVWRASEPEARTLGFTLATLRTGFLTELGRAAGLWPPLADGLRCREPEALALHVDRVPDFLDQAAPLLRAAGFDVEVPAELTDEGRRLLRARLRVRTVSPGSDNTAGFGLDAVVEAEWEAMLGDETIDADDLARLAALKRNLVRWRGHWVLLDLRDVDAVLRRLKESGWQLTGSDAVRAALVEEAGTVMDPEDPLARLRSALLSPPPQEDLEVPGFVGELRSYQRAGVGWLARIDDAGLGGCLADDMGLGKTIQLLAFLLLRAANRPAERPHLLVCPTSVLGVWEREAARFAPELKLYRHYGPERASTPRALAAKARRGTVCLTTYSLLRRDAELLTGKSWEVVVLDEAQAIKNSTAQVARAAYALEARTRLALTGTPVENRLTELWSIFNYAVPGLLGTEGRFRDEIAVPVERFRSRAAVERLHALTGPFVLRRAKTDPGVLPDLPPKLVVRSLCPLTREQVSLYRAAVDEAMIGIREADGIDRRGRVLALITALKQICNHPDNYLGESGRLEGRSGKLERLGEELEEVLAEGDAALVFTQYRKMGEILVRFLDERLGVRAPFLHGGVTRNERERMVAAFQQEDGPRAIVISLRAGGTGLTLTRASHVFHFDRWWNPAVETQATDRAHRIGQERTVVVHPLICRGTLEERIDRLLEDKADLAALAMRAGDAFLTELDDDRLESLVQLGDIEEEEP